MVIAVDFAHILPTFLLVKDEVKSAVMDEFGKMGKEWRARPGCARVGVDKIIVGSWGLLR